jgi:formamidase
MRTLPIAAVQTSPVAADPEATWARYAAQVRAVAATFREVRLVLHPELYLSAVGGLLEEQRGYPELVATTVPGPLTDRLGTLARETGLWLVPGSVYERGRGGELYNTAVVVGPDGGLAATYRKCFPWQPFETTTPGKEFVVVDLDGKARVGLAICYDGAFPESCRQLAWLGAEVILQPSMTSTRDRDLELVLARANAIFNQVWVVNVNTAAPVATGQSLIVDPEGLVRQQAGASEEVLVDVLDLDAVTRVRRHGTLGLNRPWAQLDRDGSRISLPAYGGATYKPRTTTDS